MQDSSSWLSLKARQQERAHTAGRRDTSCSDWFHRRRLVHYIGVFSTQLRYVPDTSTKLFRTGPASRQPPLWWQFRLDLGAGSG